MSIIKTDVIQDNIINYYDCATSWHVKGCFWKNNCFYRSFSMLRCFTNEGVSLKLEIECAKDRISLLNEVDRYEYD